MSNNNHTLNDDGIKMFADNPHARCPVALVLDTSSSMAGEPIAELQRAVQQFYQEISEDALASLRVSPSVITFGGVVTQLTPFTPDLVSPTTAPGQLTAGGHTPMGEAIATAIRALYDQQQLYRKHAIPHYRPWVILMSDGYPNDEWRQHAAELKALSAEGWTVLCMAMGEQADLATLAECSQIKPGRIGTLQFKAFFRWLSGSLKQESHSATSTQKTIELPASLDSVLLH